MKDLLARHNNQIIRFKYKSETGSDTNENYAVVIDGHLYVLFGYHWQECFGIDPGTGRPKVIISNVRPNIDSIKDVHVAKIDPPILAAFCEVLRKGPIDQDGYGTMKIGSINCDVHLLKLEKKE